MTAEPLDSQSEPLVERVLLSRQPIYHVDTTVLGYELLFRNSQTEKATFSDGSEATAQVIVSTLMEIGMDQMVGRHLAFINFERQLLMGKYCEALPPNRVILEILESVVPDAALLKKLEGLRTSGYRIALDDFVCAEPYLPLLEFANFVKMDLLAGGWDELDRAVSTISKYPVELIAEKVETREQVERCKEFGFRYFQGYFFCRPQNISGKSLPPNRLAMLRLLAQLNEPDVRLDELVKTIGQDVSLSYKLLRYINSALCGLQRNVESIRHATIMVGLEKMRIWASLVIFSGFDEGSREIIVTGAIRARMCELLALELEFPNPEQYFLVGMFSVLDAVLDRPMEQILPMLSLADELNEALSNHKGRLGSVLRSIQAYERRDWTEAQNTVQLDQACLEKAYGDALAWSASNLGLSKRPTA